MIGKLSSNNSMDGFYLLATAVIDKAHIDYLTESEKGCRAIERFIRSQTFAIYTLGLNVDPEAVIDAWSEERRKHRAKFDGICSGVEHSRSEKGIHQATE